MPKPKFANIALGIPKGPFTYKIPEEVYDHLKIGSRVRVPFHRVTKTGYVTELIAESDLKRLRAIDTVFQEEAVIPPHLLNLAGWISAYYQCSLGEAIETMLPKFIKKGRQIKERERVIQKPDVFSAKEPAFPLTQDQQIVFDQLIDSLHAPRPKKFLLKGVTGSGKTEIYLRLIIETLKKGKTVICLVPEIALTVHLTNYFKEHLGDHLEVLHSKLTDAERYQAWLRIKKGERTVVLGARSSIFSPLANLGLVIMDEEHENSYKQEDAPRYHAREVAEKLATSENALFLMGTATPSLEARFSCDSGRFELLRLDKRIQEQPLPEVQVIDLKNEMTQGGNLFISRPLKVAMEEALKKKEHVLLFLNRRGYSTFILCMDCGETHMCRSCKVSMTYHAASNKVICHYCNFSEEAPSQCPSCESLHLKYGGVGTEKVEAITKKIFPRAKVERLDTDRVRKRGEAQSIIRQFASGEIDILIGTQMLAKGFHFPNVTLVGVVNADSILSIPDFRAFERGFQLLTQVAGRTGRGKKKGRVIVQTFMPESYAIQFARNHDYDGFYKKEIKNREDLYYPPFCSLINIIIRSKDEAKVKKICEKLEASLTQKEGIEILGPAPLPFTKLRGYYRWHIMLKGQNADAMRKLATKITSEISRSKNTYVAVDVDPQSIL